MKKLKYEIQINTPKEIVWNTIISKETYGKWVKAFSANSEFIGEWKQGAEVKFFDGEMGGTIAKLDVFKPYEKIVAHHIATITSNKVIEKKGPMTEKWIGTKETYELESNGDKTTLRIIMETHPDFEKMFNDCWPKALDNIKRFSEI